MTPENHDEQAVIRRRLAAVRANGPVGTLIAGPELGVWIGYLADEVERIVAERLAVARCEVAARTLRGQRDFFLAIDMPVAADHCEQSATGWESQAVTDAMRIRPGQEADQ